MITFESAALLGDHGLIKAHETVVPAKNDAETYIAGCLIYDQRRNPHVFIKEGSFAGEMSTGLHEAGHALSYSQSFLGRDASSQVGRTGGSEEKRLEIVPSRFRSTCVELTDQQVGVLRELYQDPQEIIPSDDPRQELVRSLIMVILNSIVTGHQTITSSRIHVVTRERVGELAANNGDERVVRNDKKTRNSEVGAMLIEAIGMMIWENTVKKYRLASDSVAQHSLKLTSSPPHDRAIQIVERAFSHDVALPSYKDLQQRE